MKEVRYIKKHKIILLIGASGSGKSTIGKALEDRFIPQLISYTTRPIRKGEIEDEDYYFTNKDWLDKFTTNDDIAERTTYDGNEYGLFCMEIERVIEQGDAYFVCNKDGAEQIINIYGNDVIPFWLNVDEETMRYRMGKRGDSKDNIDARIKHAKENNEFTPPDFEHIEIDAGLETEEQLSMILNTVSYKKGEDGLK